MSYEKQENEKSLDDKIIELYIENAKGNFLKQEIENFKIINKYLSNSIYKNKNIDLSKLNIDKSKLEELNKNKIYTIQDLIKSYYNKFMNSTKKITIEELELSVRSYNVLKRNNIGNVEDLINLTNEDLSKLRNMGEKSEKEIKNKLDSMGLQLGSKALLDKSLDINLCDWEKLKKFFRYNEKEEKQEIAIAIKKGKTNYYLLNNNLLDEINENNTDNIRKQLIGISELKLSVRANNALKHNNIETLDDLLNLTDEDLSKFKNLGQNTHKEIVDKLDSMGLKLKKEEKEPESILPLEEKILKISTKNNHQDIVKLRLSGKTLDEIGKKHGLTRERIRQIYSKELKKISKVEEEKYLPYFEKYNIDSKLFTELFNVSDSVYNYFKDKYKIGEKDSSELLSDETLSENQLEIVRNYFNLIEYHGETVIADKISILKAYLKNEDRQVEYDELKDGYNKIVDNYNLKLDYLKEDDARNIDAILGRTEDILNTLGRYYRYYDLNELDSANIHELRELLDTEPGVYSSEVFFRENILLMKKIDIRDEYELHNLLRKLFANKLTDIRFSRMPDIYIQCNDKKQFIEEQIRELSPIKIDEFVDYMFKTYGHKKNSLKAYITSNFSKYINLDTLICDCPQFSDEQVEILKSKLTDDIYSITTIKLMLTRLFDLDNFNIINSLSFDKLGYKLRGNYIMKSNISNLEAYVREIIDNNDFYEVPSEMKKIGSTFYSYIYSFVNQRKLFKVGENKYITMHKLNKLGITDNDLTDFIEKINKNINYNEYFNLYTLNTDFDCNLFHYDFKETFYESLIMTIPEIKTFKLKNNVMYIKTDESATREKFINSFVNCEKIYIKSIQEKIENKYKIKLEISYIKQFINRNKFYLDTSTNCIYKNRETYENEIKQWDILKYIDT